MACGPEPRPHALIDKLEIVEPFQLASFTQAVVLPLDTKNTPLPDHDDNTLAPTRTVLSNATGNDVHHGVASDQRSVPTPQVELRPATR